MENNPQPTGEQINPVTRAITPVVVPPDVPIRVFDPKQSLSKKKKPASTIILLLLFCMLLGFSYFFMMHRAKNPSSSTTAKPINQGHSNTIPGTEDWKTFTVSSNKYSFKYPSTFTIEEISTDNVEITTPAMRAASPSGYIATPIGYMSFAIDSRDQRPTFDSAVASLVSWNLNKSIINGITVLTGRSQGSQMTEDNAPYQVAFVPYGDRAISLENRENAVDTSTFTKILQTFHVMKPTLKPTKEYFNTTLGIQFSYPSTWIVAEYGDGCYVGITVPNTPILGICRYTTDPSKTFLEKLDGEVSSGTLIYRKRSAAHNHQAVQQVVRFDDQNNAVQEVIDQVHTSSSGSYSATLFIEGRQVKTSEIASTESALDTLLPSLTFLYDH